MAGIPGGIFPTSAVSPFDGTEIMAAFIPATLHIQARRRAAGEREWSEPFDLRDVHGYMLFASDTFGIYQGFETPGRWVLHAKPLLHPLTQTFASTDDGETWSIVGQDPQLPMALWHEEIA